MVIWVLMTNAISLFSVLVMRAIWDEAYRWTGSYKAECTQSTQSGHCRIGESPVCSYTGSWEGVSFKGGAP